MPPFTSPKMVLKNGTEKFSKYTRTRSWNGGAKFKIGHQNEIGQHNSQEKQSPVLPVQKTAVPPSWVTKARAAQCTIDHPDYIQYSSLQMFKSNAACSTSAQWINLQQCNHLTTLCIIIMLKIIFEPRILTWIMDYESPNSSPCLLYLRDSASHRSKAE